MATFTIDIYPGPSGPIINIKGDAAGHTVIVNGWAWTSENIPGATPITDQHGRPGKRIQVTT